MKRKDCTVLSLLLIIFLTSFFLYHSTTTTNFTVKVNLKKPHKKQVIPVTWPSPFEYHSLNNDTQEKFLTYLPHSGFHNQRIELENALLLANYLNRTLLIPPVYLSSPAMPWLRYEKLYERLLFQTKNGLDHCVTLKEQELTLPSECLNNFRWSNVPWTFFFQNLHQLNQPIVFRPTLAYEWLYDTFNLTNQDFYFFKDQYPYEYQIYDDSQLETLPLDRFNERMDLDYLQHINHRVLHFGSLFGSYRVLAETDKNIEKLRFIRSKMIFQHPILTKAANKIVHELGGTNQFVGMHIRVGDGIFKLRASILVDDIYHELVDKYTDLTVKETIEYEGGQNQHDDDRKESTEYEIKLRTFHPQENTTMIKKPIKVHHEDTEDFHYSTEHFGENPQISDKLSCLRGDETTKRFKNTVLYIATDAPDPRNHPLLKKLFKVFPCTFTLNDFIQEIEDVQRLQVVEEDVSLASYLIPMVDAMIAAHGHTFYGTPHSTFSSYIERQLHPYFTGKQIQVMHYLDYYLASHHQ